MIVYGLNLKLHAKKIERAILQTRFTIQAKKTEIIEEFAQSIYNAQSFNTNLVLLGIYNINYLNIDHKETMDATFTQYNLNVFNKTVPTHSKHFERLKKQLNHFFGPY